MSDGPNEVAVSVPALPEGELRRLRFPGAELIRAMRQNVRACRRWFRVVAWALEQHPQGLFMQELQTEYRRLCALQSVQAPYHDEGEFSHSLSRQLALCLAMCRDMGWVTSRFERPSRPDGPGKLKLRPLPEPVWALTKAGRRACRSSDARLTRSLGLFLIKRELEPIVSKVRLPLAVASMIIGIIKLIHGWAEVQATVEGIVAIAGAFVLALCRASHNHG